MSNQIDLIIPGLLDRIAEWHHSYRERPESPALQRLLCLADQSPIAAQGYESTLLNQLGIATPSDQEIALPNTQPDLPSGVHCRADPVFLKPGMSDLMLIDELQLDLVDDEKALLETLVNGHVQPFGGSYRLLPYHGGSLHLPEAPPLASTPISQAAGNGINALLPSGEERKWWHSLINEFQMLLYDSELNRLRQSRNKAAISGLWCWAGGVPTDFPKPDYKSVVSPDHFGRQTAETLGLDVSELEIDRLIGQSGKQLAVLTDLQPTSQYDDYAQWCKHLENLDKAILAPLIKAVFSGSIRTLRVFPCNGICFTLQPSHRWRIWRRSRPLTHYAPANPTHT